MAFVSGWQQESDENGRTFTTNKKEERPGTSMSGWMPTRQAAPCGGRPHVEKLVVVAVGRSAGSRVMKAIFSARRCADTHAHEPRPVERGARDQNLERGERIRHVGHDQVGARQLRASLGGLDKGILAIRPRRAEDAGGARPEALWPGREADADLRGAEAHGAYVDLLAGRPVAVQRALGARVVPRLPDGQRKDVGTFPPGPRVEGSNCIPTGRRSGDAAGARKPHRNH